MSTRISIVLLIVAVLLGSFAAVGTKAYIAKETGGFTVLIAKQDVSAGTLLSEENIYSLFRAVQVPKRFAEMETWAITPKRKDLMLGRAPSVDIPKDHLVTFSQFDPLGAKREIFSQLGEGERAMSLSVGMETSVANVLRPGDYVDVLGIFEEAQAARSGRADAAEPAPAAASESKLDSFSLEGASTPSKPASDIPGGTTVRTILQRVLVLGVGERFSDLRNTASSEREINYDVITVKVTAEQAQKLLLAQEVGGRLTLTLRRPDDAGEVVVPATGRASLF